LEQTTSLAQLARVNGSHSGEQALNNRRHRAKLDPNRRV